MPKFLAKIFGTQMHTSVQSLGLQKYFVPFSEEKLPDFASDEEEDVGNEEETEEIGDHDDAADQAEEPAGHDRDESTKKGENKPQTTDKKDADENKDDADKVIAL